MNSITNVVEVTYGLNDVPEPRFRCPVGIDLRVQQVICRTRREFCSIVRNAASAVELVSRFESARYVDFAPCIDFAICESPISLRVQLVQVGVGHVVWIDLPDLGWRQGRHPGKTMKIAETLTHDLSLNIPASVLVNH